MELRGAWCNELGEGQSSIPRATRRQRAEKPAPSVYKAVGVEITNFFVCSALSGYC